MKKGNQVSLMLCKKQMSLIKCSEEPKDENLYGNLSCGLERYKTLSEKDFQNDKFFDNKARATLLNNRELLMNNVNKEWIAINNWDIIHGKIHCSICNTPNTVICYIKNRKNGLILNVGRECVKKFPGIENMDKLSVKLHQATRQYDMDRRRIEFSEWEMPDVKFIKKAEKKFDEVLVVPPYNLYNELKNTLRDLNLLKRNYIMKGGSREEARETYNRLKIYFNNLWEQTEDHVRKTRRNPLACKNPQSKWLLANNKEIWKQVSLDGGILTKETLKCLCDPSYVSKNINKFRNHIKGGNLKILDVQGNSIIFVFQNHKYQYPLYFNQSINAFIHDIGCCCLTDRNYVYDERDIKGIIIPISKDNFESIYNRILVPLRQAGLDLERDYDTSRLYYIRLPQKVVRESKWSHKEKYTDRMYRNVNETVFYEICKDLAFEEDKKFIRKFNDIKTLFDLRKSWISKTEMDKYKGLKEVMEKRY